MSSHASAAARLAASAANDATKADFAAAELAPILIPAEAVSTLSGTRFPNVISHTGC